MRYHVDGERVLTSWLSFDTRDGLERQLHDYHEGGGSLTLHNLPIRAHTTPTHLFSHTFPHASPAAQIRRCRCHSKFCIVLLSIQRLLSSGALHWAYLRASAFHFPSLVPTALSLAPSIIHLVNISPIHLSVVDRVTLRLAYILSFPHPP